ncbi:polyribonucleotide nucleotidyltransferase [Halosquirtibacter laminarini]|uniref:Polyribonucleotide nucleotidyltransferase n=1 Tax=Halosquirtibacter laminarini TaxID=3374600 RepID=A0AC61NFL0_9BACT|nr:polyribonucleotide nucleotidyltransferase [Prolixibacteraceae bacterium]
MIQPVVKTIDLGDGREISIETGKLAKQADGSVVVRMGDTMLLATVVSSTEAKDDVDFMPLTVDYREKFSAAGRFPGGFTKREGRPSDDEILVARLVDRALRPLFPSDYHAETAVMISLLSVGEGDMPDALAGLAASAALAVSDVPFETYISEARVARIGGSFVINPTYDQLQEADLDIMVGATYDNIMMVEGEMDEVSEKEMLDAIKFAHQSIRLQCTAQAELAETLSVVKREFCHEQSDEALLALVNEQCYSKCYEVASRGLADKHKRSQLFSEIKEEFVSSYTEGKEDSEINNFLINKYFHDVHKDAVRRCILDEGQRLDGRKTTEIRPIWGEVDYLPRVHGSAVFTRGETQSLTSVTLGTKSDEKIIDNATLQSRERFLLHYNFPPFCTGEARTPRGISRREIGHGNLAYRALKGMIPKDYPYVVRVISDVLESNGSSSMATVCAGTMALMDAGVQIKKPVTGIAMGLITDNEKFAVLSDILGDEDHLGDMDFKVTGTKDGITATQMDIKVDGLPYEVLEQALEQARQGRLHIMGKVEEVISEVRDDYKPFVPRIVKMTVPKDMIGAIIGPGGKIIQQIQEETQSVISIEEKDGHGIVEISATNKETIEAAVARIKGIVAVPEVGEVYKGKVKSIVAFGAFIEIIPGKDGLLHISEIDWSRHETMDGLMKEGDIIEVKLVEVDSKTGKLKLSRKALLPKPEGYKERPPRNNREGGNRRENGGNRRPKN